MLRREAKEEAVGEWTAGRSSGGHAAPEMQRRLRSLQAAPRCGLNPLIERGAAPSRADSALGHPRGRGRALPAAEEYLPPRDPLL